MNLKIASPCTESWDRMRGDSGVRFCGRCSQNVYNLSAMSKSKAEELLGMAEGRVCVRFYQRKDGTVMTRDCPVGLRERRVARISWAALAGLLLGCFASLGIAFECSKPGIPAWARTVLHWLGAGLADSTRGEPVLMGSPRPVQAPAPPPRGPEEK
jgi:hypothetical protein